MARQSSPRGRWAGPGRETVGELLARPLVRLVRRESERRVRYVDPVPVGRADGLVATTYASIQAEYLLAPPFTLHSPVPVLLSGYWSLLRSTLLSGRLPRAEREAVAAAVSRANRCPYCVEAHSMTVGAGRGQGDARAVAEGRFEAVSDPALGALAAWGEATGRPGAAASAAPPFTRAEAPEVLGTAVAFHYTNRVVSVFCPDSPLPAPLSRVRGLAHRLGAPGVRAVLGRAPAGVEPVADAGAELPTAFGWDRGSPAVASALAAFAESVEREAEGRFPGPVLAAVRDRVDRWSGEDSGLGLDWLETAVEPLDAGDRPAARLALLTALAAYRVGDEHVGPFRAGYPDDGDLVALVAWASLVATRRVASWLAVPDA